MHPIPVTRVNGEVLWNGHAPNLEDFPAVRAYVDACIEPSSSPESPSNQSDDFQLLLDLVLQIDARIPWFTKEQEDQSLSAMPLGPFIEPKPKIPFQLSGGTLNANRDRWLQFRKFMKDHATYVRELESWGMTKVIHDFNPDEPLGPQPTPPVQTVFLSKEETPNFEIFHKYQRHLERHERSVKAAEEFQKELPDLQRRRQLYVRIQARKDRYHIQKRSVGRLASRLEALVQGKDTRFERLNWTILPGDGSLASSVERYLAEERRRHPHLVLDDSRVHRILTLKPARALYGMHEFDGYLVFLFEGIPFAVLTCPRVGNALYLLKDNWETLSKLSKSSLLAEHASHVRRIIHGASGEWFNKLSDELREWTDGRGRKSGFQK